MKRNNYFFFVILSIQHIYCSEDFKADLLIFSYNRPLQLYALLESIEKYITNLGEIVVFYRTGNEHYHTAYEQIKIYFPYCNFIEQSNQNPHADFRQKTIDIIEHFSHNYLMFSVDDIIVKDHVDMAYCIAALEKFKAYGFYLRLGKNIHYCYMTNKWQPVPAGKDLDSDLFGWHFTHGTCDWAYANTVDMTLYRRGDVLQLLTHLHFTTPNLLEALWAGAANLNLLGLSFAESKVINIPFNNVSGYQTRYMKFLSLADFLSLFNEGLKIDIAPLHKIKNSSPHIEYTPTFIAREH